MTSAKPVRFRARSDPAVAFIGTLAFLALTIPLAIKHVMWRDEVRAFSVATRSPSWSALVSALHQEGHPIVWYAILRISDAVTHSVLALPLLALLFATLSAYLILRYAPFPIWARLLIVFGAFLGYEFSIMARNYGVAILLMVVACILFPRRNENARAPLLALVLAVMANTSVHAALAAFIFVLVWAMDIFDSAPRVRLRLASSISLGVVVLAIVLALETAKAAPGMAFAPDMSKFSVPSLLGKVLRDPGASLAGTFSANIAAAEVIPWDLFAFDIGTACRIVVDIVLIALLWSLRKNRKCLIATILAILAFAILFRGAYAASLRHEGVLFFLLVSLCWIASSEVDAKIAPGGRRSIARGMLPLLAMQTLALLFIARRAFMHPESSSKEYGTLINSVPEYRDAILMSEPDYMMESMPYYVDNQIFMPRQSAFDYRVNWDLGKRRQSLSLGQLVDIADSVACNARRPVLLAITYPSLFADSAGKRTLAYRDASFTWNQSEKERLFAQSKQVARYENAVQENYRVFEIAPPNDSTCSIRTVKP